MRSRRVAGTIGAVVTLAAVGLVPAAAQASYHLTSIREVFAGTAVDPGADYVELQMYASGQNLIGGHTLTIYNADGSSRNSVTAPANVANGANQSTILFATVEASIALGVTPDVGFDETGPNSDIPPTGGAVCWDDTGVDCVSWGNFTGAALLPGPTGTPAAAIPGGMALTRTIAPGCATLLESSDDTNNSATDFALTTPSPRNNATTPTETACGGGGATDTTPPAERLSASKTQDVDKLSVKVGSDEAATIVGRGSVSIGNATRLVKFKKVTKTVAAGQSVKLRFKLAGAAQKTVKNALADGTRPAKLTITATDAAGNSSVAHKTVKLKD